MKSLYRIALVSGLLVATFAAADEWKDESGKGKKKEYYSEERRGHDDRSYFHEHGYTQLEIPEGHYPPPGECRIWFPDRPPGQQPPPVKCGAPVPAGAWLIEHPPEFEDRVHITVYEPQVPGRVVAVGEFNIGSGALMRVVFSP